MSDPISSSPSDRQQPDCAGELDTIFVNSLRESYWILGAWLVACVWTLVTCSAMGYESDAEIPLVLGMPSWVFWGILIPWVASTLFTLWFAIFKMADGEFPSEPIKNGSTVDGFSNEESSS